jgi:hypothetical protein
MSRSIRARSSSRFSRAISAAWSAGEVIAAKPDTGLAKDVAAGCAPYPAFCQRRKNDG